MGSIEHVIHGAKPTAPGPDGLPCAAWQQSSLSEEILYELMLELLAGFPPPVSLNDLLLIVAPKGREERDSTFVMRSPRNTRPLALKNTDVKIISSTCNHRIKGSIAAQAHKDQGGAHIGDAP
eukprot:2177039-Pyramimonas_sp.AAC.1